MAIGIQQQRATFGRHTGGLNFAELTFSFGSNIRSIVSAIQGFDLGFTGFDKPVQRTLVEAFVTSWSGNTAIVRVNFGICDASGNFDDPYNGSVDVVVIADLA